MSLSRFRAAPQAGLPEPGVGYQVRKILTHPERGIGIWRGDAGFLRVARGLTVVF